MQRSTIVLLRHLSVDVNTGPAPTTLPLTLLHAKTLNFQLGDPPAVILRSVC